MFGSQRSGAKMLDYNYIDNLVCFFSRRKREKREIMEPKTGNLRMRYIEHYSSALSGQAKNVVPISRYNVFRRFWPVHALVPRFWIFDQNRCTHFWVQHFSSILAGTTFLPRVHNTKRYDWEPYNWKPYTLCRIEYRMITM